ncbi:hypothetical protein EVAR_43952_1 [Eumeta japonica]|uniref:Uncharacterized protein n=1 Tax=Eumeta variegata TaxID=151549 RepID=A0A4C1XXD0_EUMVA|nr:hypothetical protein EVAR_43952_1 [Eumeta japonica]
MLNPPALQVEEYIKASVFDVVIISLPMTVSSPRPSLGRCARLKIQDSQLDLYSTADIGRRGLDSSTSASGALRIGRCHTPSSPSRLNVFFEERIRRSV